MAWPGIGLLAGCLVACGGQAPPRPLLDAGHAPEVLVEQADLALPPAAGPNRFGAGWRPAEGHTLAPASPAAQLEVVSLGEGVPRTLSLSLALSSEDGGAGGVGEPARSSGPAGSGASGGSSRLSAPGEVLAGRKVRVHALERDLGAFALAPVTRILLPEDLPAGRLRLNLLFDAWDQSPPRVLAAGVAPVLPAGAVLLQDGDLIQSGNSLAELRFEAPPSHSLVGFFVPPRDPRPGQQFSLAVERSDGTPIRRFEWLPSFWNRHRGTRGINLPLRDNPGPLRLRLLARGAGSPCRWRGLGLVSTEGKELPPGL